MQISDLGKIFIQLILFFLYFLHMQYAEQFWQCCKCSLSWHLQSSEPSKRGTQCIAHESPPCACKFLCAWFFNPGIPIQCCTLLSLTWSSFIKPFFKWFRVSWNNLHNLSFSSAFNFDFSSSVRIFSNWKEKCFSKLKFWKISE